MRCTGYYCPMQNGYDVENCKQEDCIYKTETLPISEWAVQGVEIAKKHGKSVDELCLILRAAWHACGLFDVILGAKDKKDEKQEENNEHIDKV